MEICILGATGLVGRETLELCMRAWPGARLYLFASRDQKLDIGSKSYEVKGAPSLLDADAPRGDVAFVALDDEHSRKYVPRLVELGYRVVDKSNTYRGDPQVPLVTAGVNHRRVNEDTRLVANPNCTSIPLALALWPLHEQFGLEQVTVSTYQAVSGAGIATLDAFLAASQQGYIRPDRLGAAFEASGYAGNVLPHSGGTDDSGFSSEERKVAFEAKKILELQELSINAQCCRVAVAVGHYENVWLTLERAVSLDSVAAALAKAPFVRFLPGAAGEGLSAIACTRDRDRTLVGRLRLDPRDASGRSLCLTVVADNLRLGAATNAVRIASRWHRSEDPELQA